MSASNEGSGDTPSVLERDPIVKEILQDMGDTWRLDDGFFDKFFPVGASSAESQKARKKLHHDNGRYGKRWKGIPKSPKSVSSLYGPLTNLMNEILSHYGIDKDKRLFLNTHFRSRRVCGDPDLLISPGIFLAGAGPEFANTVEELPRANFPSGLTPFEVSLDSVGTMEMRGRLAVHMYRMFQHQDNRRFAFGVVITESVFTVYMFDHSGAVASPPCNYHQHPEWFCSVISELASEDVDGLGFDTNIYTAGRQTNIRTLESTENGSFKESHYIIKESLFQSSSLVGRGTICWLTTAQDDSDSTFVVKDAWIALSELAGRESEGSLLRHAQNRGIILGVAQIRHFEEVRRAGDPSDLDTIFRNRKVRDTSEATIDRVHTRIVMATHGKTLDKFTNRQELLLAFHDAVAAHQRLHEIAGILHRDVSAQNILINPEGISGDRGILIDFDHAIRVSDTSPYSTKTRIGTWRYMSRNVLDADGPHTYLDDLESFYYVFCWILVGFEGPGKRKQHIPKLLSLWDHPASSSIKYGLFNRNFRLSVSPWFGSSLSSLIEHLHLFFKFRFDVVGNPLSSLTPAKDYEEFLSHIRQCVEDLAKEYIMDGAFDVSGRSSVPPHPSAATPSQQDDSASEKNDESDVLSPRNRRRPPVPRILATVPSRARPRRRTANYGPLSRK